MAVLVTGGAGYIGSHAVKRLLTGGHAVVVLDNLVCGNAGALVRLQQFAGRTAGPAPGPGSGSASGGSLTVVNAPIDDTPRITDILKRHDVRTVMHFAALSNVGDSVKEPLRYYHNNTAGTLSLLRACAGADVDRFIFSSTAATYGQPEAHEIPIRETCPQRPINPYGASKLFAERMLADFAREQRRIGRPFAYAILRYFNVAGCDTAGLLGEDHHPETHLIPVVLDMMRRSQLMIRINGGDYPTPDGSCVRDYVHVEDLVDAHAAVMWAMQPERHEEHIYNLGIGRGYSVREVIAAAERITGYTLAVDAGPRRPGDPATLSADPTLIRQRIGWEARITSLEAIIDSAWRWMLAHPRGYAAAGFVESAPTPAPTERVA